MHSEINKSLSQTAPIVGLGETWLNTKQTADKIDTTPPTLAVWRCTGRYPGLRWKKRGRRVFYLLSDVVAFMAACPFGTASRKAQSK